MHPQWAALFFAARGRSDRRGGDGAGVGLSYFGLDSSSGQDSFWNPHDKTTIVLLDCSVSRKLISERLHPRCTCEQHAA